MGTRSLDKSQDWKLIAGAENTSHTILEFSRQFVTCDTDNDLEIFDNEYEMSNIVFAVGSMDPESTESIGEPLYERVIHLSLFSSETEPKEKDIQEYDLWTMNVSFI